MDGKYHSHKRRNPWFYFFISPTSPFYAKMFYSFHVKGGNFLELKDFSYHQYNCWFDGVKNCLKNTYKEKLDLIVCLIKVIITIIVTKWMN